MVGERCVVCIKTRSEELSLIFRPDVFSWLFILFGKSSPSPFSQTHTNTHSRFSELSVLHRVPIFHQKKKKNTHKLITIATRYVSSSTIYPTQRGGVVWVVYMETGSRGGVWWGGCDAIPPPPLKKDSNGHNMRGGLQLTLITTRRQQCLVCKSITSCTNMTSCTPLQLNTSPAYSPYHYKVCKWKSLAMFANINFCDKWVTTPRLDVKVSKEASSKAMSTSGMLGTL